MEDRFIIVVRRYMIGVTLLMIVRRYLIGGFRLNIVVSRVALTFASEAKFEIEAKISFRLEAKKSLI